MLENVVDLNKKFEEKKLKVLEMRQTTNPASFTTGAWGDDAWGNSGGDVDIDAWPTDDAAPVTQSQEKIDVIGSSKYRALYEFVARNQDEISFQPGDIINVSVVYFNYFFFTFDLNFI